MVLTKSTNGANFPNFKNFLILKHKVLLHLNMCGVKKYHHFQ